MLPLRSAFVLASVLVASLLVVRSARAEDPWLGAGDARLEERYLDGEIDTDDLAVPSLGRGRHAGSHAATWLTLTAFYTDRGGRFEAGGMAMVGIALDEIASGRRAQFKPVRFADPPAPPQPAPSPAPQPAAPRPLVTPQAARACVSAAWRAAGLSGDDRVIDSLIARARLSAALPEVRLRATRQDDAKAYVDERTTTDARYYDSQGANLWLEARLTWRLDRLLYADDEPSLERMRRDREEARLKVASRVLEALFQWQRASIDRQTSAPGTREELEAQLRIAESLAVLDVLTGGWFTTARKP